MLLQYFKENPDYNNASFNSKYGIYSEGCGLDNVMISWGHDDYMYLVRLSLHMIFKHYYQHDSDFVNWYVQICRWLRKMEQLCLRLDCSSSGITRFIVSTIMKIAFQLCKLHLTIFCPRKPMLKISHLSSCSFT